LANYDGSAFIGWNVDVVEEIENDCDYDDDDYHKSK
jgi:hypothetical protein